ncbi:hypothetical protein HNY73_001102 [Argiope bruennichi]|uniref:Uncharacterized protein n=1 Tax=Argiope bruennichi TaxID=94029 RepID=A0A8T0G0J1_ARGBR|nr:hypothetical protein HNY73_001102 [Argiope bruennichi]
MEEKCFTRSIPVVCNQVLRVGRDGENKKKVACVHGLNTSVVEDKRIVEAASHPVDNCARINMPKRKRYPQS